MRALVLLLTLCALTSPAFAGGDVVLGPVATGGTSAQVKAAAKALVKLSPRPVEPICFLDTACLAKAGEDAGARRVIAAGVGKGGVVRLTVIDVEDKLVLGAKDVKVGALPGAVEKVVESETIAKAKALFAEALWRNFPDASSVNLNSIL